MRTARANWKQEQPRLDPRKFVFIDETGTSTNMTRLRGRCPRGKRLVAKVPHGHWKMTSSSPACGRTASRLRSSSTPR